MAAIRQDDRAYRRGVVFGFTVAEIVLLLVFCLLLLFVPLLLGENTKKRPSHSSDAIYVEAPPLDAAAMAGQRPRGLPSDASAPENSTATKERDRVNDAPLGDPSTANNTPPGAADPLPEGWIRVAPNAANATQKDGSRQPERPSQPAADVPFEALPLTSVCDRLGIPVSDCTATVANQKISLLGRHNWPPIIKLKEADGEFFVVGSAQVSPAFEDKIRRDVVPKILDLVGRFQTDVVEIVGHTDEQPIMGATTNLDALSIDVIAKNEAAARLSAADNAGLGFARALAVVQILKTDSRLERLTLLPLSAAQMIDVDGKLSNGRKGGDVKERRRIELRVRQSGTEEEVSTRRK